MKIKSLFYLILLAIAIFAPPGAAQAQDFPDVCQEPENILANCDFSNGLDPWKPYLESGSAQIQVQQGGGECHAPLCPALHIVSEDQFVGGIYQQVPVTAGNTYYANIVWLVFDSLTNDQSIYDASGGIGRRIGIDPYGGTDPTSSNIIWGPDVWRNDCKICNVEQVTATAQADTITVFLRIDDTWRGRLRAKGHNVPPSKDQFWFDDLGLKQVDGSAAESVPAAPPPTDTPVPPPTNPPAAGPTATPEPASPTDTPEPVTGASDESAEESPEAVAQAEPTEVQPISPIQTPAPASTLAPPPTLTPSVTPTQTDTPEPRPATPTRLAARQSAPPSASKTPILSAGLLGVVGTSICVGGLVLVIMGGVLAGMVWLYRLGWAQAGEFDDDHDDYAADDDDEIIVEIVE